MNSPLPISHVFIINYGQTSLYLEVTIQCCIWAAITFCPKLEKLGTKIFKKVPMRTQVLKLGTHLGAVDSIGHHTMHDNCNILKHCFLPRPYPNSKHKVQYINITFTFIQKSAILQTKMTKCLISLQRRSWWQWWGWSWTLGGRPWQLPTASQFQTQQRQCHAFRGPVWPPWIRGTGKRSNKNETPSANKDLPMTISTWLKSMLSIISLVSSGRLVRKRIWLGGALSTLPPPAWPPPPPWWRPPPAAAGRPPAAAAAAAPAFAFFDFFALEVSSPATLSSGN